MAKKKGVQAAAADEPLPDGETHAGAMRAVGRVVAPIFAIVGIAAAARLLVVAGFACDADATPLWLTVATFAFAAAAVARDHARGATGTASD